VFHAFTKAQARRHPGPAGGRCLGVEFLSQVRARGPKLCAPAGRPLGSGRQHSWVATAPDKTPPPPVLWWHRPVPRGGGITCPTSVAQVPGPHQRSQPLPLFARRRGTLRHPTTGELRVPTSWLGAT
jgi:hypothetical protein